MTTTSSSTTQTTTKTPSEFVNDEFETTWQWRIDTDPELAASLGLLSQRRSKHTLDPRSLQSFEQRIQWVERALIRIQNGITSEQIQNDLTKEEQLSYELYVKQLSDYVTYTREHKAYLCCINRLEGPQSDLPLYAKYIPVNKGKQWRIYYRDFLKAIPIQINEVIELLKYGLIESRTPPQISLTNVVNQLRTMIDTKFHDAFQKPITTCFILPDEQELKEECQTLVESVVTTAFIQLTNFLETEYIPNLRTEISATNGYPNGRSYYVDCLKFHTTTNMTPQEIHTLGINEVQRVRDEMEKIATNAGYKDKLDEYLDHLRTSSQYEPKSSTWLLAHYRDIVGRIYPQLLNLFHLNTLPRQPLEILETPVASATMAPAAYYLAGSTNPTSPRPGMFYVNTYQLSTRRTYECEALALHEAIPGHHTQGAIQGENPLPNYRRFQEDRRYFEAPCRFPFYTGYIGMWLFVG